MALLTQKEKDEVRKDEGQHYSNKRELFSVDESSLDTALTDADTWIDNNWTSFTDAITADAKAKFTDKQIEKLFVDIAVKRYNR